MHPAVFLDRDNTVIHNDGDLGDPGQVRLIQGAASAIASLRGLGYRIVIITNQGGVARGKFKEQDVDAVNARVAELVKEYSGATIDRFYFCPYHPEGSVARYRKEHAWRKPKPGMLLKAAADLDLDLAQSWTIGDQIRDVQAGRAAGTRTILLDPAGSEYSPLDTRVRATPRGKSKKKRAASEPDFTTRALVDAVKIVAQQRKASVGDGPSDAPARASRLAPAPGTSRAEVEPPARPLETSQTTDASSPAGPSAPMAMPVPDRRGPSPKSDPQSNTRDEAQGPPEPGDLGVVSPVDAQGPGRPAAGGLPGAGLPGAGLPGAGAEQTLRQILQELRIQRAAAHGDLSQVGILAVMLQTIAAICLLAGLWLGAGDLHAFVRWIGAGIIIQLGTITLLLVRR